MLLYKVLSMLHNYDPDRLKSHLPSVILNQFFDRLSGCSRHLNIFSIERWLAATFVVSARAPASAYK